MKQKIKKITSSFLILTLLSGSLLSLSLSIPQKVEAQYAVVEVGASLVQQIIIATNTTQLAFNAYSDNLKEFVLDGIAGMFAKQIVRQITQSVVNWINSGFEGSPSFVTNPSSFFLDLADQETGRFLAKYGGPLTNLCTPFSIDLRIALAFKYHPYSGQRYACTLGTIISNTTNAVKNSSINGFTAGDFRQGGWPAFVSLTTEPQNNVYGAWIQADTELSLRVANVQIQRREELNQGKGFLSWRKCTKVGATGSEGSATSFVDHEMGDNSDPNRTESNTPVEHVENCEIQTPGSVIAGALESNLGSPIRQLELADELNEIVNALFAQLVTQVLSQGLGAISGGGSGDSNAYINQIIQESPEGAGKITEQMLPNLQTNIDNAKQYKQNKDEALAIVVSAKQAYDAATTCYNQKLTDYSNDGYRKAMALSGLEEVARAVASRITPVANELLAATKNADDQVKALTDIQASTTLAKTVNDLRGPSEKYSRLLQSQSLISPLKVSESKKELDKVKEDMDDAKSDAQRKLQQCTLFSTFSY